MLRTAVHVLLDPTRLQQVVSSQSCILSCDGVVQTGLSRMFGVYHFVNLTSPRLGGGNLAAFAMLYYC